MKRSTITLTVIFLLGNCLSGGVGAQDSMPTDPYSGDLLTRSTLTGDWGGIRNQLADKGVTFDLSITQVGQGIVNGGKNGAWEYGGRGDIVMNVDTGKVGLWPSGILHMEAEGNWASSANGKTGAIAPVNTNQLFPVPVGDNFNLDALNFTQFLLSHYFGLTVGKYTLLTEASGDMNEFAHGKGDTQFMNTAFNANPAIFFTTPYSALGTGVIGLPTQDPKEAIVSFMVMQSNGQANTSGFNDLDGNQLTFAGEGRVRTDFFGLTGHQLFGSTFSNRHFFSIDQRLGNVIENGQLAGKKGSWNIYYNFDQYLYEPKKGADQGVGIFGRFGASDGNPNFMHFFYSLGVGGKGMFSRPHDQFGLGYYFIDINNPTLQGPFRTVKLLRDEYGFEAYYNVAITPWAQLTPDIQVVRGAQKDQHTTGQDAFGIPFIAGKKSIGTNTVLGLRVKVLF